MPGIYLVVTPVEKGQQILKDCPQIPHITLVHSPEKEDLDIFKKKASLDWIGEEFSIVGVSKSCFLDEDNFKVCDRLLKLDDASNARIASMRSVLGPAMSHWNLREPHITAHRSFKTGTIDPLPSQLSESLSGIKVKVIGILTGFPPA